MKILILFALLSLSLVDISYAGEQQWATFIIDNQSSKTLYLTDVLLNYGKWYRSGCQGCELKTVEQTIEPSSHALINAAGRLLSPTGTDGEFAIYDGPKHVESTSQILHLYFSVPFLIGTDNTLNVREFDAEKYPVEISGGRQRGANLGVVKIRIHDKDILMNTERKNNPK